MIYFKEEELLALLSSGGLPVTSCMLGRLISVEGSHLGVIVQYTVPYSVKPLERIRLLPFYAVAWNVLSSSAINEKNFGSVAAGILCDDIVSWIQPSHVLYCTSLHESSLL